MTKLPLGIPTVPNQIAIPTLLRLPFPHSSYLSATAQTPAGTSLSASSVPCSHTLLPLSPHTSPSSLLLAVPELDGSTTDGNCSVDLSMTSSSRLRIEHNGYGESAFLNKFLLGALSRAPRPPACPHLQQLHRVRWLLSVLEEVWWPSMADAELESAMAVG